MESVGADFVTVREGATLLGVSEFTLRGAIRSNRITSEIRNGRIMISRSSVEQYRAKTQPNGVPQVGRPPSLERRRDVGKLEAYLGTGSPNKPYTVQQLIEKRETASKVLGNRIRLRRIELGWTQKHLGERLGFTRELIVRYESGQGYVHAADLPLFAEVLEVDLPWLFGHMVPTGAILSGLWKNVIAMSDDDKAIMTEIATVFARRRGANSQETIDFGSEFETSLNGDRKTTQT